MEPVGRLGAVVSAVIPCLDEEEAIGAVVREVLSQGADEVIVVDGGSQDATAARAEAAGARVVLETQRGYGRAMMAGINAVRPDASVILFLDGDGSDRTAFIGDLVRPIAVGRVSFVHGSRTRGERESGSLSFPQVLSGFLAGILIRATYGASFTDMSPFRAISRDALAELGMAENGYGWNLEMLMRVAARGLPSLEIPVGQRRRAGGTSKVSGNLRASIHAAVVIAATFLRLARALPRAKAQDASR
jgi:glycosyltransferase involved in cell wall biosynthesis